MRERHGLSRRRPEAASAPSPLAVLLVAICLRVADGTLPEEAKSPDGTPVGSTVGLSTNWQDNMPDPTGRHSLYSGDDGGAVAASSEASTAQGSTAPVEEAPDHISGIRDVEQCKDELELMTQRLRDRERSPLAAYWNGLSSWLHDNPYQIVIALVALTLGLVCAWAGSSEWPRLTSAGAAAAAAGVACYEADAWELDRTSHILLLLPAAALGGGAAFTGQEGYQALLGASVGFWTSLSVAGGPEHTFVENLVPGLGAFWCSIGAILGALALTVWRRRSLAALAPLLGGLLAASGAGVLVSRLQALLTGKAGAFLPEPDAPWSSAAMALLVPIGHGTFLGHFCSAALALGMRSLAGEKRRRFAAIGLAGWALVIAMAAALTLSCQSLGGKGQWCDFGPGPEGGGWSWTLCGLLLWVGISVPAGFRQFGLLDEELAASGDYMKVASIGSPPGQASGEFRTLAPSLKTGEAVEYYNETKGIWVSTRVVAINPDGTYWLECRPDAPIDRIRPLPQDRFAVFGPGEVVGYFSASRKEWIPGLGVLRWDFPTRLLLMAQVPYSAQALLHTIWSSDEGGSPVASERSPCVPQAFAAAAQGKQAHPPAHQLPVVWSAEELQLRVPLSDAGFHYSTGSMLHDLGRCTACAAFASHKSCHLGALCPLCHFLHEDDQPLKAQRISGRGKPSKAQRTLYREAVTTMCDAVHADPTLTIEGLELPGSILSNEWLMGKFCRRMEKARQEVLRSRGLYSSASGLGDPFCQRL